jgi:hypothetical protein
MSPREKAKELIDKHVYYVQSSSAFGQMENAKACALITVEELLNEITSIDDINWWKRVIEQINNYEI